MVRSAVAVAESSLDRRVRHRVHRVRAEQLVDVERVRVVGVLRRRRPPERALRRCARGDQLLPALAREDAGERAVGQLRVGHGGLAAQVLATTPERFVDLQVHARHEEARDRGRAIHGLACLDAALEPAQIGLGDLLVADDREQERDVHVHPARGQFLEGAHACIGARHLDEHVLTADRVAVAAGLRHRGVAVMGERRRKLERDVAVGPVGGLERRPQQVRGVADVEVGEPLEQL